MSEPKTKAAHVVRDFKDVNFGDKGVERRFAKGENIDLPEGVSANYEHAGLVREPTAADAKADSKKAAPAA